MDWLLGAAIAVIVIDVAVLAGWWLRDRLGRRD